MPEVLNKRTDDIPENAVYVGRPTKWGNPFTHRKDVAKKRDDVTLVEDLDSALRNYRVHLMGLIAEEGPEILDELKGKDLVCWCSPAPCHADILMEIANDDE